MSKIQYIFLLQGQMCSLISREIIGGYIPIGFIASELIFLNSFVRGGNNSSNPMDCSVIRTGNLNNPLLILGNTLVIRGNPFAILRNPLVILENQLVIPSNPLIFWSNISNPYLIESNPRLILIIDM